MDLERLHRRLRDAQDKGDLSLQASTSKKLADLYYEDGKYEEALTLYKTEEKVNKRLGNPMDVAVSQRMLCECSNYLGEFKNATVHGKEYLRIAQEQNNFVEEQRAWVTIGRVHYALAISIGPNSDDIDKKNSFESALEEAYTSYKKSLKITSKLQHISHKELSEMNCRLMLNMALVVELKGDVSKAVQYLTDAVKICKSKNLLDDLYRCYYALGDLYKNQQILDKSLEYFNLAVLATQPLDNQNTMCEALLAKAKVLISQGHYKQAKDVIGAARKLHLTNSSLQKDISKAGKVARCLFRTEIAVGETLDIDYRTKKKLFEKLGDVSAKVGNYLKAVEYYHQMLKYAELAGDTDRDLVPAYVSLAQTYKDLKKYDKVIEYYKKELEVHYDDPREACLSTLNIAEALYLSGACYAEIEEEYLKARSLADETGQPKMVGKVLDQLLKLQIAKKLVKEAAETVRELDLLNIPEDDSDESDMEETPELDLSDSYGSESEEEFDRPKPTRSRQTFRVRKNDKGETALHTACIQNKMSAVQALIKQGHPLNELDNCGWTPLHEACNKGFYKIVEVLLDHGARVNEGSDLCGGVTPLHDAASNYHPQVIELLLERGADATRVDSEGRTALHYLLDMYQKDKDHSSQAELNAFYEVEEQMRKSMIKAGVFVENLPPKSIHLKNTKHTREKSSTFSQTSLMSASYASQSTNSSNSSVVPKKTRKVCGDVVAQRCHRPPAPHRSREHRDRPKSTVVTQRRLLAEPDSEEELDNRWKPLSPVGSVDGNQSNSSGESSPIRRKSASALILSSPEDDSISRRLAVVEKDVGDAVETYSKVMTSLRYSTARESSAERSLPPIVSKSTKSKGFLAEEEVADDEWLEEDCRIEKHSKKRKMNNVPYEKRRTVASTNGLPTRPLLGVSRPQSVLPPTGGGGDSLPTSAQPFERHSSTGRAEVSVDRSRNVIAAPSPDRREDWPDLTLRDSDDELRDAVIDLDDWNLIEEDFSLEQESVTTTSQRHTISDTVNRQSRPPLSLGLQRQRAYPPIETFRENSNVRAASHPKPPEPPTRAPVLAQAPEVRPSMGIKVRVKDSLLFIPVKSQDQTFGSLSVEVSDRYCRQFGVRPTLSLHTKDGAILVDSDPVSLVYGCDEISASVTAWNVATLTERYDQSCKRLDAVSNPLVRCRLSSAQPGSLTLVDLSLTSAVLAPVFHAVHEEDGLTHLDLSGSLLADAGMKVIAECLPKLQQLRKLNLSDNAVTWRGLKHLGDVIKPPDVYQPLQVAENRRLLQNLTDLDLSHNFFGGDNSWVHLSNILDGLSLTSLQIQSCHLQSYTAAFPPLLSLETVSSLDMSFNPLGCDGVSSFLGRVSPDRLARVNMAATTSLQSPGSVIAVLRLFLERDVASSLRSLDLSDNDVEDTEIPGVLELLRGVPHFESLHLRNNPRLTCASLGILMRHPVSELDLSGCLNVHGDLELLGPLGLLGLKTLTLSTDKNNDGRKAKELWLETFRDKAVVQNGPFGMLRLVRK